MLYALVDDCYSNYELTWHTHVAVISILTVQVHVVSLFTSNETHVAVVPCQFDVKVLPHDILYRYFIASREIYQNVCPEVPGNPRDVIFPEADGGGKYNISGIPGNRGTNVLVYFPRSNEITVMLHFTRENA